MTDKPEIIKQIKDRQTNDRKVWFMTLLSLLALNLTAFAAPDISVSSVSGVPGGSVSVSVVADFTEAVNAIQFQLQFDPKFLKISGVKSGSGNSSWTIVNNPNILGKVNVAMYNAGGPTSAITGLHQEIAVINFTADKHPDALAGSSALTLRDVIFDTTRVTQLTAGTLTVPYEFTGNRQDANISGDKNV